ncbi:right-handed parallel beta-helix repeat-containing protein [Acinetobacter sp. ANC 3781]
MKLRYLIYFIIFSCFSSPVYALSITEGTDITHQLNQEISKLPSGGVLKIPAGRYKVDATKSIILKSNISVELSSKTHLEVIPNKNTSYRLFKVHNVKNVNISGGNLSGDKYTHLDNKGQWGMGIDIKDSQNIKIRNMNINKMWGDAIYVGTLGKNTTANIKVQNIKMNDNRRQGISITSVNGFIGNDLTITNTSGVGPQNGIDIEPNDNKALLQNIKFRNLKTNNNEGVGFQASMRHYNGSKKPLSISLDQHTDKGSAFGFVMSGITSPVSGTINISNVNYTVNSRSNFCFSNWKNNKIEVLVNGISHDIKDQLKANPWCEDHKKNSLVMIKDANFIQP